MRPMRNRMPAGSISPAMEQTRGPGGSVPPSGQQDEPAAENAPAPARTVAEPRRSLLFRPTPVNVKLIYSGYLASLALPPIALVAGVYAHQCAKQNPPHWLATHFLYQQRTFWIGLFANLIAWGVSFTGAGLLLFPLIAVWVVARSVKGLIRVAQQSEIEEPLSYFV